MIRAAKPLTYALVLLGLVANSASAFATVAEGARQLTLDDALALAKKHSWNLKAGRARVAQAQTNISSAWALLLPNVSVQGRYTRNYAEFNFGAPTMPMPGVPATPPLLIQPINQLDGIIQFTAPLLVPAAYPGLQAVKGEVAAAEATYEVSQNDVLFAVAQSYYAAAIADEVLDRRGSNIGVARATLANAKTRFSAGTVTKVDVDRAELALVRAEQAEREARHGRDKAYRALGTLLGLDSPFRVSELPTSVPQPTPQDSLDNVLHLRPEFRTIELQLQAADDHRKAEAWRWSPSLSAFGNARRFNYQNFNRDRYSWAVGLQLEWVIYDGGGRDARRHLAAAQAEEALARAEALRETVRDDLANTRGLLETKQHAVEAATRSVTLARETIDLVRTQYEAGTVTQVDLLQAQDGLVGAEETLAQARFDVAVADLSLRRAAGTFPPR
jgi:outer membrane protein/protease secretion system outer membrane protein